MSLLTLQTGLRDWLTREDTPELKVPRPEAGLSVYLNNYRAQLMACLSESYPTLHAWLGHAAFEAAAAQHIDRSPPFSWTLDAYGLGFPATLRSLYPHDPEVGDLAALECALAQAFIAPDSPPLDPASLAAIDWDRARLRFIPALTLLPASSNAGAIWSAITQGETPPAVQTLPQEGAILIWREGFTPAFRTLESTEARALEALQKGCDFGALCAMLVAREGEAAGPQIAGAWLAQWLADAIIAQISNDPL
ncbi:HvfC/BufC family peptide modification chaperone [Novosphingobium terrae]|uniref:HvfC/BufC family peptide modification chaperone n=1 Tax=Novosphingobium terrae TaxID=2726189 RepID=UPI001981DBAA|nr:putative DNA-binding domain-containing protein [Novosphingobium terrae]